MKKLLPLALIAFTGCIAAVDDPGQRNGANTNVVTGSGGSPIVGPIDRGTGGAGFSGSGGAFTPGSGGGAVGSGGNQGPGQGTGGSFGFGSGGASAPDGGVGSDARPPTTDSGAPAGTGGAAGARAGSGGAPGTGGRPAGTGGAGTGGRPAGTGGATVAAVCTSNVQWNGQTGPTMRPGNTCNSCHSWTIAGTVYPTLHEPTNCNGVNGSTGVRVVITGANGTVLTLTPTAAGNFYTTTSVALPFTAKVTSSAGTRAMPPSQSNGNCNSCHTQAGANGAPGRIMAP